MTRPRPHEEWMRRALRLAENGRFLTSPNPMVGAVIVSKGRLISEGWHRCYGGDHAEVEAIRKAGTRARGAVLYVTLEPCSTWGKTPPCVDAIIKAGIKKVVIAARDPNPLHKGRAESLLKKAGIEVETGILAREAGRQNESFFKWITTGFPFVTLKMAQSLDGKIAARTGRSRWISSKEAREFVHTLRAEQDAVLVGKNTLLKDNPRLSPLAARGKLQPGKPWRIAIDPDFSVSPKARIFEGDELTLIAVNQKKLRASSLRAVKSCVTLLPVKESRGQLNLRDLFRRLGQLGITRILVEGGGETAWSLLDQGLADKAYWIVAPKIIGGRGAKTSVEGIGVGNPDEAIPCEFTFVKKLGADLLLECKFAKRRRGK